MKITFKSVKKLLQRGRKYSHRTTEFMRLAGTSEDHLIQAPVASTVS